MKIFKLYTHGPGVVPLQVMETRAMSRMECMDAYGNVDIICTTSEFQTAAPCDGDFGSPAVFNDTLYGISSFIISGCKTQSPQGFIDVFFYRKFIDKVMNPNAAPNGKYSNILKVHGIRHTLCLLTMFHILHRTDKTPRIRSLNC
nr:serine protease SP24D-like [Penaeus vannamei]